MALRLPVTRAHACRALLPTAKPQLILPRRAPIARAAAAPTAEKASPIIMNGQVLHSITSERLELVRGLEGYMRDHVGAFFFLGFGPQALQRQSCIAAAPFLRAVCACSDNAWVQPFASRLSTGYFTSSGGCLTLNTCLQVNPLLKPVDKCWQPTDFLPRSEDPDFLDKVHELRERAKNLPDDYLVVFAGELMGVRVVQEEAFKFLPGFCPSCGRQPLRHS